MSIHFHPLTIKEVRRETPDCVSISFEIPLTIKDSLLVTTNSSQRHTLYYNRTSNVFGADVTFQDQQNKQLLSNGFEFRNQKLRKTFGVFSGCFCEPSKLIRT